MTPNRGVRESLLCEYWPFCAMSPIRQSTGRTGGSREKGLAPQTGFALTTTWLTTDPDWRRVESLQFSVPSLVGHSRPGNQHSCRFNHVLRSRSSLTGQYKALSSCLPSPKGERGVRNTTLGRLFHIFLSNPKLRLLGTRGGKVFGRNERFSRALLPTPATGNRFHACGSRPHHRGIRHTRGNVHTATPENGVLWSR